MEITEHLLTLHQDYTVKQCNKFKYLPIPTDYCDVLNITVEDCNKHVRVFDEDDHLILIHYIYPEKTVQHIRGIIIDKSTKTVVCSSYPYTEEYDTVNVDSCDDLYITPLKEGTVLRLFYYNSKFYLCTHKKLDASKSSWGNNVDFATMFSSLWNGSYYDLFKEEGTCHSFLLSHSDARLVYTREESKLYYIVSFKHNKLYMMDESQFKDTSIQYDTELHFETPEQLQHYVDESKTGVMVLNTKTLHTFKILNKQYHYKKLLYGNEQTPHKRYMLLKEQNLDYHFVHEFPELDYVIKDIEVTLIQLRLRLLRYYITRYINKQYLKLDKFTHILINNIYKKILKTQPNSDAEHINAVKAELNKIADKKLYFNKDKILHHE